MFRNLPLQRLDRALTRWRELPYVRPQGGWLRAIRTALGMTTRQMATRVGVSQAAVVDAERNEAGGDITLNTLRRYAAALDCEVFYALVPRVALQATLEAQAGKVARDIVARRRLPMSLEDLALSAAEMEQEVTALRAELLGGRRSKLWR